MKYLQIALLTILVAFSCKENIEKKAEIEKTEIIKLTKTEPIKTEEQYVRQSVDDQLAANIKSFLVSDYLKKDITGMQDSDRKFQLYKIDLNNDGKEEIIVRFLTPYFCGTGGCTFLLLGDKIELITEFSVTNAPIYAEDSYKNGWQLLLVWDSGFIKELAYKNGTYPSNPSLLEKAPYDAPSGHAEIMFDEDFSNCKTYNF